MADMATPPTESFPPTLLQTGEALVVGGYDCRYGPRSDNLASLFDPITGWRRTDSLIVARAAHTATLLRNGSVLVTGGYDWHLGIDLGSAELYNPSAANWRMAGYMSAMRGIGHTATLLTDGTVLLPAAAVPTAHNDSPLPPTHL